MVKAIDGVPAATGRGFLLGVLWCIGFGVVFALGRVLVPEWAEAWGVIALVVMILVATVWRRAFPKHAD